MTDSSPAAEPTRAEVDNLAGATLLEFGASWCGHCQAAQPAIRSAMQLFPQVRHIKIEDGKGRRLGRSFHVKLWPTLIFLKEGIELTRLVRQSQAQELNDSLQSITAP
ncbi:thioredoxin family protein [Methylophilus flavus]|uniref:Thioredoxin family protein n=1 Tax=Methylophilus flavus TaxID=640084 RepID=A0ABW3P9V5_9PROT